MKCSIEFHEIKLTNLLIQFCLCFLVLSCKIKCQTDIMAFQAPSNNNKQWAVPLPPLHSPKRKQQNAHCSKRQQAQDTYPPFLVTGVLGLAFLFHRCFLLEMLV